METQAIPTTTAGAPVAATPSEDVLQIFSRILTYAGTVWMRWTYPFAHFGRGVSIHHSCELRRSVSARIKIGNWVYIAPETWLNVPEPGPGAAITLEDGCKIGRRCMISARNSVRLEADVMLGPGVLITDHSHEFSNPEQPIHAQGLTAGGTVVVERNAWLGFGACIVCTSGTLVVGRNSVVGANSVVTRSVPPYSVVAGNPAKIIRRYDPESQKWTAVHTA